MTRSPADADRLRDAFERCSTRVLAYALRHDPSGAHDVVSEVFLTAWRRLDDLPDDPLPWLLVVARNVLRNRERGRTRQQRLADELAGVEIAAAVVSAEDSAVRRQHMLSALARLSATEREALLLTAWDGLSSTDAARVAGCSRHAFEVRLSRARARLARELHDDTSTDDVEPEPTAPRPGRAVARPTPAQPHQEITR